MIRLSSVLAVCLLALGTAQADDDAQIKKQYEEAQLGAPKKPDIHINEVSFQGPDGYVRVRNRTEEPMDIGGYSIVQKGKDGEVLSQWTFPAGTVLAPKEDLTVARNGDAYAEANPDRDDAEFEFYDSNAGETPDKDHAGSKNLALSKDTPGNDEVTLDAKYGGLEMLDPDGKGGSTIIFWGSDPYLDRDFIDRLRDGGSAENMPEHVITNPDKPGGHTAPAGPRKPRGSRHFGDRTGKAERALAEKAAKAAKKAKTTPAKAEEEAPPKSNWLIWILGGIFGLAVVVVLRSGRD